MTINKSQCKSLSNVGLYMLNTNFPHGQLYVVISRVRSISNLKILTLDKEGKCMNSIINVVYK